MSFDLKRISTPAGVKGLAPEELLEAAAAIREFLIRSNSETGGHIGANLGVVELTLALHRVFDSPRDALVFDTGHQGYTHKIVTGRLDGFATIDSPGGLGRFLRRDESPHDTIDASHAGTSVSTALGIALARKLAGDDSTTVAVIGDGSLVEGLAWEGLNHAAIVRARLVLVVNDNGMAIAPNVGGVTRMLRGGGAPAFFAALGFDYRACDGHDVPALEEALRSARERGGPVVVHVTTEKGRGLEGAEHHPYRMHFSPPFEPDSLEPRASAPPTYAQVAGDTLHDVMSEDRDVMMLCPATPYASKVERCLAEFPDRAIDVGMAEQHAVSLACGLALGGRKPVVCFQSTFMQRAMDPILHDLAYMDLPVTLLVVRSGFSGYDGPTHHGLFDLAYLRAFPNLRIVYPKDACELSAWIRSRLENPEGPMVILHPYDPLRPGDRVDPNDRAPIAPDPFVERRGRDGLLLCVSNRIETARSLQEALAERGADFGVAVLRQLKPLPSGLSALLAEAPRVVSLEEGMLVGGLGSAIAELICDAGLGSELLRSGVGDHFLEGGTKADLSRDEGLDERGVLARIERRWPSLLQSAASSSAGSAGAASASGDVPDNNRRTISSGS